MSKPLYGYVVSLAVTTVFAVGSFAASILTALEVAYTPILVGLALAFATSVILANWNPLLASTTKAFAILVTSLFASWFFWGFTLLMSGGFAEGRTAELTPDLLILACLAAASFSVAVLFFHLSVAAVFSLLRLAFKGIRRIAGQMH